MYACGPTVYDAPHIGHLRSAFVFGLVRRYLTHLGYRITFVQNVTDIDDKIIEKARASGSADLAGETKRISKIYHEAYRRDLDRLGVERPDVEPFATEHVGEMIGMIEKLLERGFAYVSGGDVYFDVDRFESYGKLSHQRKEGMRQNVRIDPNEKKKDALDFALWKKAKPGEPFFASPWGEGRPGWHIECSAMSTKYLGETFDIHGGGRDLIFPHHENEIAQSECAGGKPFARFWIHHGLVTRDGQKMSKSLQNYVTLGDLSAKGRTRVEELKFLFLGTHYRAGLDYSEEKMKMEKSVRERFLFFFEELRQLEGAFLPRAWPRLEELALAFAKAMDDDFNTSLAITVMHEMAHEARKTADPGVLLDCGRKLKAFGGLLGVSLDTREETESSPEYMAFVGRIEAGIRERAEARGRRDYKKADEIRERLTREEKVILSDLAGGKTTWRRI